MRYGDFSISGFMVLILLCVGYGMYRLITGRRKKAEAEEVRAGMTKSLALSKVLKMSGENVVAILKVSGPILAASPLLPMPSNKVTSGASFAEQIQVLAESGSVDAIIVEMATPGGSPAGSDCIRDGIERAQAQIPVFVYVKEMSASGGMWSMATAKNITAAPGTILGSVGVISATVMRYSGIKKMSGLFGRGIEAESITGELLFSGSGKGFGHPFAPEDEAARKRVQAWLDSTRHDFLELVASRPGVKREALEAQGASVYGPKKALEIGVIDRILPLQAFRAYVAETLGKQLEDVQFVRISRRNEHKLTRLLEFALDVTYTLSAGRLGYDPLAALRKEPVLMMLPQHLDD